MVLYPYLKYFIELFYPSYCVGCEQKDIERDLSLCNTCYEKISYACFENGRRNPITEKLETFNQISYSNALFYFTKNSISQKIIYAIKYQKNDDLAFKVGEIMNKILFKGRHFSNLDCCIPVPISKKRLRQRGFNQTEILCKGILGKEKQHLLNTTILVKKTFSISQTKLKGIYERYMNVEDSFVINNNIRTQPKHILLVDDIITTGSTTNTCITMLRKAFPEARVSVLFAGMTIRE